MHAAVAGERSASFVSYRKDETARRCVTAPTRETESPQGKCEMTPAEIPSRERTSCGGRLRGADADASSARTGTAGSCASTRTWHACGRAAGSSSCARSACACLSTAGSCACTSTWHACGRAAGSGSCAWCRGACARSGGWGRGRGRHGRRRCARRARRRLRRAALVALVVTAAARSQRECDRCGSDTRGDGETTEDQAVSHGSNLGFCEWHFLANGLYPLTPEINRGLC